MSETKMPAVEASTGANERELVSYELAFHVLPTIAEGEVPAVFAKIKNQITKHGGELGLEEVPARIDLAYEIIKYLEGRNRKFASAYFGWIRFQAEAKEIGKLTEEIEGMKELLRHLLIKLSRVEEENPFFYHEALNEQKVKHVDLGEDSNEESDDDSEVEEIDVDEIETEESDDDGEKTPDKV